MKPIVVAGIGAVSPAGWGASPLVQAVRVRTSIPASDLPRPAASHTLRARRVPAPNPRPTFLAHPRLRRTSPITHFLTSAALEALGTDAARIPEGWRVGIISCVMAGCVGYSRRFYDETLRDPSTASPLVFPETVFNAPASHLGAILGSTAPNYTLVGDSGTFLQALALAADWLQRGEVDGCLVVGAEECDWLTAEALRLFLPQATAAEGAAALYLRGGTPGGLAELGAVTSSHVFTSAPERAAAARAMRTELGRGAPGDLLVLGSPGRTCEDPDESAVWAEWPGAIHRPLEYLGNAFAAGAGWQCVLACAALADGTSPESTVSVVGINQQAIGAQFRRRPLPPST